jgi:hypothetical protein
MAATVPTKAPAAGTDVAVVVELVAGAVVVLKAAVVGVLEVEPGGAAVAAVVAAVVAACGVPASEWLAPVHAAAPAATVSAASTSRPREVPIAPR